MAIVVCKECGKEISDQAMTCPHCGYPILAVKNAQIHQQNKAYYKEYNKTHLWYNLATFGCSAFAGYLFTILDLKIYFILFIICAVALLIFLFVLIPFALISILAQKYFHIPKWVLGASLCFGYVIGSTIGKFN